MIPHALISLARIRPGRSQTNDRAASRNSSGSHRAPPSVVHADGGKHLDQSAHDLADRLGCDFVARHDGSVFIPFHGAA